MFPVITLMSHFSLGTNTLSFDLLHDALFQAQKLFWPKLFPFSPASEQPHSTQSNTFSVPKEIYHNSLCPLPWTADPQKSQHDFYLKNNLLSLALLFLLQILLSLIKKCLHDETKCSLLVNLV